MKKEIVFTRTTESRAAMVTISAQDTTPLQTASNRVLMLSITSYPLTEFAFGPAVFSPVNDEVSSNSIDPSHPFKETNDTYVTYIFMIRKMRIEVKI